MRTRLVLLSLSLLPGLVLACHTTPSSSAVETGGAAVQPDASGPSEAKQPAAEPRDRSVTIPRRAGHSPHEVELDPRAEVALTVDKLGRMRLWPAIRSGDGALAAPYELPMQEPLWMSVAQADEGFVVATIDTTNAGQALAVVPSADGHEARLIPLFSLPPSDPLLELHALDGGQRFLALGVDHRVRLYDRSGAEVSVIDQRSFVPWQLRVVHAEPGQPPKIAAMLAQPLRVQAIELRDDELAIRGEARTVVIDRGPNRNDLLLGPDGKTVAALRRRSGRGRDFSIELIDLETDARRLVAGQTDTTIRPRMHFVDAGRILLETGSRSGRGIWVDLSKAEALEHPADAEPDSKLAKRLAKTKHDSIPLVASAEVKPEFFEPEFDPPWDHGERFHASVVAGIRVNIERGAVNRLVVDPLDSDRHWRFDSVTRAWHTADAIDRTGAHQVSASANKLWITRVDGASEDIVEVEHGVRSPRFVAFADDRRVVVVDHGGKLELIDWQAGQVVASTKLDFTWTLDAIAFHENAAGGVLGWRGDKRSDPARLLSIANGALGDVVELPRDERSQWLDILELGDAEAAALLGISESAADDDLDEYTSDFGGRLFYTNKHPRTPLFVREGSDTRELRLPAGQGRELAASPDGSKIAVVQFRERDDSVIEDHLCSVFDVETGERLWTLGSPGRIEAPRWSADGRRIVVQGVVRDATTGEPAAETGPGELSIEDRADADWARQG